MDKLKELLRNEGASYEDVKAPAYFESRLQKALMGKHKGKKKRPFTRPSIIVASLLILLFASYHYNTIAYFGKKMVGYDEVLQGSLATLNEQGRGQVIDKSFTYPNGVILNLDGVMLDNNKLVVFYTLTDPSGNIDKVLMNGDKPILDGFIKEYIIQSGHGKVNDENTEVKLVEEFEVPFPFEKRFTFELLLKDEDELLKGEIPFTLNRSKALKSVVKQDINKNVLLGEDVTIRFDEISASPLATIVKGKITSYDPEILSAETVSEKIDFSIVVNGRELSRRGTGVTSGFNGLTFDYEFEGLPNTIENLEIHVTKGLVSNDMEKQKEFMDKKIIKLQVN